MRYKEQGVQHEWSRRRSHRLSVEIFQLGIRRTETQSAFRFSPLRIPNLLAGAIGAFLVLLAVMYVHFLRQCSIRNPYALTLGSPK